MANTPTLIERLIERANMHDKFGPTYDGKICREAAAALAEANNQKVIRDLLMDIAYPKNANYTEFLHPETKGK